MKLRSALIIATLPWMSACSEAAEDEDQSSAISFCGPANTCPPDTTGVDLTAPVSFRSDIFEPIFQTSCNGITCHGPQGDPRGGLWLGPSTGDAPDAMLESIVTSLLEPSATAPEMNNVEPGNPDASFLMLKVDGCQDQAGLSCTVQEGAVCDASCGDGMPQFDSPDTGEVFPLTDEQRHAIRAWIAQGAQNN